MGVIRKLPHSSIIRIKLEVTTIIPGTKLLLSIIIILSGMSMRKKK